MPPGTQNGAEASISGRRQRIREVADLFLQLGLTAFGGPAAHLAMMDDQVVRRRRWMTSQEFLDLVAVTNLIPGPNSTELAIYIGYRRGGWPGLIVGGLCFILPAFVIVLGLAWLYVRFHTLPVASGMLRGIQPVVVAIIAQALWRLTRTALKSRTLAAVGLAAIGLSLLGVHELVVLLASAGFMGCVHQLRMHPKPFADNRISLKSVGPWLASAGAAASTLGAPGTPAGLWPLFLFFLKVGSVLYGSGYVLVAFLRADLVERWGWLTEFQLLDAIAIGQVTPGPLFTTATFIGYLLCGPWGAFLGTAGVFLPAFVFVAASAPLLPRLRNSRLASAVLDGLNVGSLALMFVVTLFLAHGTLVDSLAWVLAVGSLILLLTLQINSTWLIAGGVLVGMLFLR